MVPPHEVEGVLLAHRNQAQLGVFGKVVGQHGERRPLRDLEALADGLAAPAHAAHAPPPVGIAAAPDVEGKRDRQHGQVGLLGAAQGHAPRVCAGHAHQLGQGEGAAVTVVVEVVVFHLVKVFGVLNVFEVGQVIHFAHFAVPRPFHLGLRKQALGQRQHRRRHAEGPHVGVGQRPVCLGAGHGLGDACEPLMERRRLGLDERHLLGRRPVLIHRSAGGSGVAKAALDHAVAPKFEDRRRLGQHHVHAVADGNGPRGAVPVHGQDAGLVLTPGVLAQGVELHVAGQDVQAHGQPRGRHARRASSIAAASLRASS